MVCSTKQCKNVKWKDCGKNNPFKVMFVYHGYYFQAEKQSSNESLQNGFSGTKRKVVSYKFLHICSCV